MRLLGHRGSGWIPQVENPGHPEISQRGSVARSEFVSRFRFISGRTFKERSFISLRMTILRRMVSSSNTLTPTLRSVPPPRQFLEECEKKEVRVYGTWKNIRKIVGVRAERSFASLGTTILRRIVAWKNIRNFVSRRFSAGLDSVSLKGGGPSRLPSKLGVNRIKRGSPGKAGMQKAHTVADLSNLARATISSSKYFVQRKLKKF